MSSPEVIGGRYRVQSVIGQGGMGTVWLCTDDLLGRQVAVKQVGLLPGESAPDSARALREARSTAALNHRNVVSVFDIVEVQGSIWMVMEYVPSASLAQIVRDRGALPPEQVAAIGGQVADGLAAAHAAGVIHRDVKPANILVTEDGLAKIGDFGIARSLGDEPLTQAGLVTGTPSYFSPELAEGHEPGPESDVWALGASLYFAVEGRPPYPHQTNPVAMLRTIASQPPEPMRRAGFLEQPLGRMLDRDPGSRWAMADAAHTLHRLAERHRRGGTKQQTVPVPAPVPVPTPEPSTAAEPPTGPHVAPPPHAASGPRPVRPAGPPPEDRPRRRLKVPLLPALVAVLLLAVVGGGYLLLHGTGAGTATRAGGGPSGPASRGAQDPSRSPTPSASPTPSHTPTPKHQSAPAGQSASPAGFIRDYYRTAPQDLNAGWAMVGPGIRQVGRSSYDDFWRSLDRVDVQGLQTSPDAKSAEVTLTYHFDNGKVTVERQRLDLIRSAQGGYLINGNHVQSSRTVS